MKPRSERRAGGAIARSRKERGGRASRRHLAKAKIGVIEVAAYQVAAVGGGGLPDYQVSNFCTSHLSNFWAQETESETSAQSPSFATPGFDSHPSLKFVNFSANQSTGYIR